MQVEFVGVEGGLPAKDADPEDAQGVENGDGQDAHRDSGSGLYAVNGAAGKGGLEEVDHEKGDDEAKDERSGVAHKDLVLIAEDVKAEEYQQRSCYLTADDVQFVLPIQEEPGSEGDGDQMITMPTIKYWSPGRMEAFRKIREEMPMEEKMAIPPRVGMLPSCESRPFAASSPHRSCVYGGLPCIRQGFNVLRLRQGCSCGD